MASEPITILITAVKAEGDKFNYQCSVASSMRAIGFPLDEWEGTVLSANKVPVTCRVSTVETAAAGIEEGAECEDDYGDEPFAYHRLERALRHAAANLMEVEVSSLSALKCPVFISSDPGVTPVVQSVRVRLGVRKLCDLPDVQGYIAYSQMMDRLLEGSPLGGSSHTHKLAEVAAAANIRAGQYLPIAAAGKSALVPGVIYLKNQVAAAGFEATLYLAGVGEVIEAGAPLYRNVEWAEGDCVCKRTAIIASIEEEKEEKIY